MAPYKVPHVDHGSYLCQQSLLKYLGVGLANKGGWKGWLGFDGLFR